MKFNISVSFIVLCLLAQVAVAQSDATKVKMYVNKHLAEWKQKQEGESAGAYRARVNMISTKKKQATLRQKAIAEMGAARVNNDKAVAEYNLNRGELTLTYRGLRPVSFPMSQTEGANFIENVKQLEYDKMEFLLLGAGDIALNYLKVKNPGNGKTYTHGETIMLGNLHPVTTIGYVSALDLANAIKKNDPILDKRIIMSSVNFDTGKSSLTKVGQQFLDTNILPVMKEFDKIRFKVLGHTDSKGDWDSNMRLSVARAENVVNYLIENGVDPTRLLF